MDFFFYGTLCHRPLLDRVLGRRVEGDAARLPGYAAFWAEGRPHPMLVADPAGETLGLLVRGLSQTDLERLDFYEGGFAFLPRQVSVLTKDEAVLAYVYFTEEGQFVPGEPWVLGDWQQRFGAAVTATAADVMRLFGRVPAAQVQARYGQMLVRGDSRVRAEAGTAPATLRRAAMPGDVAVDGFAQPYARFFAVEEYDLRFRQFSGGLSAPVNRAVFVSGDAVTVLPYDPRRDRVLLVEQFRVGPFGRGDLNPWSLEAIAGRIDPGESAEDCARREALEEAGLTLGAMLPVAHFYPSPGAKTEFIYNFVALTDLPDGSEGVFGVEDEAEDIKGHLIAFDHLMELVSSGEVNNGLLILTALWLERERPRLRQGLTQ